MLDEISELVTAPNEIFVLKRKCADILNLEFNVKVFFGSQPVSLQRKNLLVEGSSFSGTDEKGNYILHASTHVATEKTDGERFLLLLEVDSAYLISRKMEFRRIRARFPLAPKNLKEKQAIKYVSKTILDGELLQEASGRYVFYIFDSLAVNGRIATHLPFLERLRLAQNEIVFPKFFFGGEDKLSFKLKDFYPIQYVEWIFNEYVTRLGHHSDGIIFNHLYEPYLFGKTPSLLKWKPESENTCDFAVDLESSEDATPLLLLYIGDGGSLVMLEDYLCSPYDKDLIEYARDGNKGAIIECFWDRKAERVSNPKFSKIGGKKSSGGWRYLRRREDKELPNDVTVMRSVISSIAENISKEEIMKYCRMKSK